MKTKSLNGNTPKESRTKLVNVLLDSIKSTTATVVIHFEKVYVKIKGNENPPEIKNKIFQSFCTPKPINSRTGQSLLSICQIRNL